MGKRIVDPDPYYEDMIRRGMDVDTYLRYWGNRTVLQLMLEADARNIVRFSMDATASRSSCREGAEQSTPAPS